MAQFKETTLLNGDKIIVNIEEIRVMQRFPTNTTTIHFAADHGVQISETTQRPDDEQTTLEQVATPRCPVGRSSARAVKKPRCPIWRRGFPRPGEAFLVNPVPATISGANRPNLRRSTLVR